MTCRQFAQAEVSRSGHLVSYDVIIGWKPSNEEICGISIKIEFSLAVFELMKSLKLPILINAGFSLGDVTAHSSPPIYRPRNFAPHSHHIE